MEEERFKTIYKPNSSQEIINHIKYSIATKDLLPGDRLMTIEEIAEIFHARITQVREAVMYLVGAGILEIRRCDGKGIYVANNFSSAMLDPMVYSVILGQSESLDDFKEMQKYIELSILTLAAKRISKENVPQLSVNFEAMQEALKKKDDLERIIRDENEFYFNVFEISQNEPLIKLAKTIRMFTSEAKQKSYKKLMKLKRYEKLIQSREELFEALIDRNPEEVTRIVMNDFSYK